MITVTFLAFLALSATVALVDWRRGWLLALCCGILQDPARKLTPGTPVAMTFSIMIVYAAILFASQRTLQRHARDLSSRFPNLYVTAALFLFFLGLAAINGLFTYGMALWKVPALSLFIYLIPVSAIVLGYAWIRKEEHLTDLFTFYATLTSITLIGTPLEYFGVRWNALGLVALSEGYIRHLPGLQIRILSGFYRAPDIMGWHAATLTMIGIAMTLRARVLRFAWPWIAVAGWGFFNCMISGRRKAIYMVVAFVIALLWRYFRRLTTVQIVTFLVLGGVMAYVVHRISADETSSVYARGAATSQAEVLQRLEGGLIETLSQTGVMGAGLGTATQGVRHLTGNDENVGWQEGGLGKLAIEVGLPGLLAAALLAWVLMRTLIRITREPDDGDSTQLLRATLFAMVVANGANFLASAQAYSDAVLTLTASFLLGTLLAMPALRERRLAAEAAEPATAPPARALPAPA
jgi:hypothetical protein